MLQVLIGDECLIRFSGVELGSACTVVIRGATQQVIDEAERSLHDALCVLAATVKEPKVVFGGGMFSFSIVQYIVFFHCTFFLLKKTVLALGILRDHRDFTNIHKTYK